MNQPKPITLKIMDRELSEFLISLPNNPKHNVAGREFFPKLYKFVDDARGER